MTAIISVGARGIWCFQEMRDDNFIWVCLNCKFYVRRDCPEGIYTTFKGRACGFQRMNMH